MNFHWSFRFSCAFSSMASSTSFMLKPNPTKVLSSYDVYGASQAGSLSFDKKYTATSSSSFLSIKASASAVSQVNRVVKKASSNLARVWREVQGVNNWEGLLEPLNSLLQGEIIRYGEFVTACYKAFDLEPNSRRYLNCKYGKKKMLKAVGMEGCGYEVTKYIYATPDITIPTQNGTCCSRWIGYVAVSSDEEVKRLGRRDVVVTFRGTVTNTEWIANFMSSLSPARLDPYDRLPNVKVESGFLSVYTSDDSSCKFRVGSCREQLLSELSRIINKYKTEDLSITLAGHSMGSSLAVLHAYDVAELGLNKNASNREIPITVFSFGGPRVGNSEFKKRCEELGVKVLRVVNTNDPVTKLPGIFFNEKVGNLGGRCYAHLGVELALDFFKMQDPACVHDLETYIDLLRCPKKTLNHRIFGSEAIVRKAKEMVLTVEKFETYPWQNAARNVGK